MLTFNQSLFSSIDPTYHKSAKVSPPPFPRISWAQGSMRFARGLHEVGQGWHEVARGLT